MRRTHPITAADWAAHVADIERRQSEAQRRLNDLLEQRRPIALAADLREAGAEASLRLHDKSISDERKKIGILRDSLDAARERLAETQRREREEADAEKRRQAAELSGPLIAAAERFDAALAAAVAAAREVLENSRQIQHLGVSMPRSMFGPDATLFRGALHHAGSDIARIFGVTSPGTAAVRRPLAEVLKHRVSLHQMVTAPTAAAAAGAAGSTEPAAAAPAAAAE